MLDGLVQDAEDVAARAPVSYEGAVAVTVYARESVDEVERFLNDADVAVRNRGRTYIEAFVPVGLLGPLSELDGVIRVEPVVLPSVNQTVGSGVRGEGADLHGALAWHDMGYDGSGVKVGVIDAGFGKFVESRAEGEVPEVAGAKCYFLFPIFGDLKPDDPDNCGGETHGTMVAETVVDVAPGVDLYIANPGTRGDLLHAVEWMIDQGVTVINYSMGWSFDGPGDGTSPREDSPLHAVDMAVEAGITWVNSAGNENMSSWLGEYSDSDGDGLIEFYGSLEKLNFSSIPENTIQLRWDDDWGGADTDLDIFVYDSQGELIASSQDNQTGEDGHDPYEKIVYGLFFGGFVEGANYDISVQHVGGPPPRWIQLVMDQGAKFQPIFHSGGGVTNPAESANEGMLAVGEVVYQTPEFITITSSRGPTPDGRVKPDIVGAGSVLTSLSRFEGTSQASPHVAGLAALVRQRYPERDPAGVAQYLKNNADPRPETPGADVTVPNNTWGYGLAYLPGPEAAAAAAPTPTPEPAAGPTQPGTGGLIWRYETDQNEHSTAVSDGVVYVESYSEVYALDADTGGLRWRYDTGGGISDRTLAVFGGVVYVGSEDGYVYALDADTGGLRWRYKTGDGLVSSTAVSGGVVYVGSLGILADGQSIDDGYMYALDAGTGNLIWRYAEDSLGFSSPAVFDGVVYVGSFDGSADGQSIDDGYMYALDAASGELRWRYKTGDLLLSSPAVSGGVVYAGSVVLGDSEWVNKGYLYALDAASGELRWRYETGGWLVSSPAVSGGVVYAGSGDNYVYALDAASGELRWRYKTGDNEYGLQYSPAVFGGVVYVGSTDGYVYALDAASGELRWRYETGGWLVSSPAVSGGVVYAGSNDGYLYALDAGRGLPADDHGDSRQDATPMNVGSTVDGDIEVAGDIDYFSFRAVGGQGYVRETQRGSLPGTTAATRSAWVAPDSSVHFIAVGGSENGIGTYRLTVSEMDTGELLWRYKMDEDEDGLTSSPAVSGGVVYARSVLADREWVNEGYLYALDAASGELRWRGDEASSSTAVSGGVVYVGSADGSVYALDAETGKRLWQYETGGYVHSSVRAVSGGVVYVEVSGKDGTIQRGDIIYLGGFDDDLYALDAETGQRLWQYETGETGILGSLVVSGGVVYVGALEADDYVYALDAETGEPLWQYEIGGYVRHSPVVSGGVVYVGTKNGLYAVDAESGELRWRYATSVYFSPVVSGGVVYVGMDALDAETGEPLWQYETGTEWGSAVVSPVVSGGVVYFISLDGLYAVDAESGELRWRYATSGRFSPVVSGGVVYFSSSNHLYALDARTGELLWVYRTGGEVSSSLVVVDGVVYVGSEDGYLYAVSAGR